MPAATTTHPAPLHHFEDTLVEVFSELADLFGNPRSHGQIYGILFASPAPLTMQAVADRLRISKGSASQGLRALETLGAVQRHTTHPAATYSARLELKLLISGFVRQRLHPRLHTSKARLHTLRPLLAQLPDTPDYTLRLRRVTQWHDRALQVLPLAQRLLDSASKLPSTH